MSEILRGQQGHPTPDDREAGPLAEIDPGTGLPTGEDWRQPEAAEAALDAARGELQQAAPDDEPADTDSAVTGGRSP